MPDKQEPVAGIVERLRVPYEYHHRYATALMREAADTITTKEAEIETWKWAVGAKDKQILEFADALEAAEAEATILRDGIKALIKGPFAGQSVERIRDRLKALLEEADG